MRIRDIRIPYWFLLLGPALVFAIGFMLNALAITANGGYMTVQGAIECVQHDSAGSDDVIHVCMTHASHLKFLSDWIYWPGVGTASPGDFLEMAGQYSMYPGWFVWLGLVIKDYSDNSWD